ncbi:MAG: hypothetical protein AB7J28_01450 [Hyphomonadaceae bacterium]
MAALPIAPAHSLVNTGRGGARAFTHLLVALTLAACAPPAEEEPEAPDVAQEIVGAGRRDWIAANEQARLFGGNLAVSVEESGEGRLVLAFANGITIRAAREGVRPAQEIAGRETYAAILGLPPGVAITTYRVEEERVSPSAALGGLCGALRTTLVAAAEYVNEQNAWTLRLGAFHRPADAAEDTAPNLCFALDYAQPA